MTKIEILALAVRLFGIFLLITVIRGSSAFIFTLTSFDETNNIWLIVSSLVNLFFILGTLAIIKFPLTIAGKLIPKSEKQEQEQVITFDKDDIQYIGFTIIGMFMIVRALPDMFYWVIFIYKTTITINPPMILNSIDIINVIATVIEIIIGLIVLFGADGLQNMIYKIKMLGVKKVD